MYWAQEALDDEDLHTIHDAGLSRREWMHGELATFVFENGMWRFP